MCDRGRRAIFVLLGLLGLALPALAQTTVHVSDTAELIAAIDDAAPGDTILLGAGTYLVSQNLVCDTPGTAALPILVRARELGNVLIQFDALEGIKVNAPHWIFENLDIQGVCADHDDCEHAFHLAGPADHTTIRHCRVRDFNAQIKSNGDGAPFVFPDDVLVEHCEFGDTAPRQTARPVTKIDVVGGRRWVVRDNFIHDHQKAGGDTISYAAFFKGNSRDGLFERNLVICERDHSGGVRLGLSLGGGGTGPDSICEESTCNPEHQNGVLRNNVIVNCPADVGIYLNEAANTGIYHNTLIGTTGIDVRFTGSTAFIRNNLVSGAIRNRDGGISTQSNNSVELTLTDYQGFFADPLEPDLTLLNGSTFVNLGTSAPVTEDFCGNPRDDGQPDRGAVEYDGAPTCAAATPGATFLFRDGFESGGYGRWTDSFDG